MEGGTALAKPKVAASGIGDVAAETTKGKIPSIAPVKDSMQGRTATAIVNADPTNVTNSENLATKALQYTKAKTERGMAKELEDSIGPNGKRIEQWAKTMDKQIGDQPKNEIVDQIMERVQDSTVARANPQLLDTLRETLNRQLDNGQIEPGMDATNLTKLNETRKYLSSNKSSWFDNGRPVGNPTNDLNALEWEATGAIKEILDQADEAGVVKDALDRQHVALQVAPVMAKKSLSGGKYSGGIFNRAFQFADNAGNPVRIEAARKAVGSSGPRPGLPEIPDQTAATSAQMSSQIPKIRSNVPSEVVDKVVSSKSEAQARRLKRDMRSKSFEFTPKSQKAYDREVIAKSKKKDISSLPKISKDNAQAGIPVDYSDDLQRFANRVTDMKLSKKQFIDNFNKGLKEQNPTHRETAEKTLQAIKSSGHTLESFYDAIGTKNKAIVKLEDQMRALRNLGLDLEKDPKIYRKAYHQWKDLKYPKPSVPEQPISDTKK